ncbi:hypothetical protein PGT21_018728 [Puccinia graminis f. sp. tritici]|uniref:Uncharacterized protein n=1 Tax=Puccinia graminis f. sp. tritici TaxID=56615 RepID=A0A5B0MKJ5_PUCGR|nr:hypothetical protein PGT21_018728 [Puccinia graminis f. sp. tritici]
MPHTIRIAHRTHLLLQINRTTITIRTLAVHRLKSQSNHPLTDAEELDRARKVAANAVSSSYNNYHVPQLSDQKDKSGRFMISYHCKM